jgi:tetratricopeptide (TPR) repeat protein
LKALGRLDEASQEYKATVRDFPENAFARTGRAEVLKALGRLDEALREYEATVRDFPENVVARTGRAEVLKALGRLDEALQGYEAATRDFPRDVFARTGKAEVLKALGRLDEALLEYEGTVRDFPQNVVARNGRASCLVLLGRLQEALGILPQGPPRTLEDWIAYHIRATISLRRGDTASASDMLERGLRQCPWPVTEPYFRGTLAVARLRTAEFSAAVEVLGAEDAPVIDVLRIHAFGGLGDIERARQAFERVRENALPSLMILREELKARYITREPKTSLRSDAWLADLECDVLLAA